MLRFLLNLSITPLPAEELNETLWCVSYWICLLLPYQLKSEINLCWVSYWICLLLPYQLKNWMNFMLRFIPNYVCHLLACTREDDLCRILCQKWCPVSPLLSRRSVLSFVPNLWFVFCCRVGWSLLCNVFYVMSCLFHINCATWSIV